LNTNPNAHPKNKGLIKITTKKIIAKAAGFVKRLLSQGKKK
jgi:ribosomal protein S17E